MSEPPRRVDLRLTIPVAAPYPDLARDLAQKFVEYAGATAAAAADVSGAITAAVAAADGRTSILLVLTAGDGDVTISVSTPD
jgi:hypothetical protein